MQDHNYLGFDEPDFKTNTFSCILERTTKQCRLCTLVSLVCSLSCCYLLVFTNRQCQSTKMYYFVLSAALYSMVNFMHYVAILRCLCTKQNLLETRFRRVQLDPDVDVDPETILLTEVEKISRAFAVVKQFKTWAYYVIFICGNIVFLQEESGCDQNLRTVAFIMLSFGYIFSGFMIISLTISILMFVLSCPLKALFNLYQLVQNWQKQRQLLENAIKYISRTAQTHNCQICMNDIKKDQLVSLPCRKSSEHIFHLECLRNWIKVKQICPICRGGL